MEQVTGQLAGIEARSAGWMAVAIHEEGRDWPIKLSTKRQELVGQAQQLIGQMVTAVYNEQESTNINPHSGQPYINRYLEGLSLAGQQPMVQQQQVQPPMAPQNQPSPQTQMPAGYPPQVQQRQTDAQREVKIHRQAACKVAVQLLPLVLKEGEEATLSGLLRISEALVQYFNEGVQWTVQAEAPPEQHSVAAPTDSSHGNPSNSQVDALMGPHPDMYGDDIPFAPSIY